MTPAPYSTADFIADVFGRCDGEDLIAFGSRRPHPTGGHSAILPSAPIPVAEFSQWFPELQRHELDRTQFLALNPLQPRAGLGLDTGAHFNRMRAAGGSYFRRAKSTVSALSTICLDLDVGRPGTVSAGAGLGVLFDLADRSRVPWPSIVARSGRGLYSLWLLRSEDCDRPPPTTPEVLHRADRVISELLHRLADLEADPTSRDVSKWFKAHGTTDDRTGRRVVYLRFHPQGSPALHTLDSMAQLMGIRLPSQPSTSPALQPRHPPPRQVLRPGQLPRGSHPSAARVADLHRLHPHIQVGYRHMYLLYFFNGVYRLWRYLDPPQAHQIASSAVQDINKRFQDNGTQILSSAAVQASIIDRPPFPRLVTNARIISDLKITAEVAERYGLLHLVPEDLAKRREQSKASDKQARQAIAAQVDSALLAAHSQGRKVSPTQLAKSLGLGDYPQYVNARRVRLIRLGQLPAPGSTAQRQTGLKVEL